MSDKDTIYRQDAIDAVLDRMDVEKWGRNAKPEEIRWTLERLPSAQPEYKELQDWKTDFKGFIDALDMPRDDYRGIMKYIDEVPSAQPEYKELQDWKTDFKGFIDALDMPRDDYRGIMKYIDEVPSAQPKRGKWIVKTDGFVIKRVWGVCSECGNTLDFSGVNAGRGDANFCPNCGAKMEGVKECVNR